LYAFFGLFCIILWFIVGLPVIDVELGELCLASSHDLHEVHLVLIKLGKFVDGQLA